MKGEKFARGTVIWVLIAALGILLFSALSQLDPAGVNPVSLVLFGGVWTGLSIRWGFLLGRMD